MIGWISCIGRVDDRRGRDQHGISKNQKFKNQNIKQVDESTGINI
jgi:hypothetical protein